MSEVATVRIFLASPSADTLEARARVVQVVNEIGADPLYAAHVRLDLRRWDDAARPVVCDRAVNPQQDVVQQIGSPAEIYMRPVNLFVAGFLGSPTMNTMRGTLTAQGGRVTFAGQALNTDVSAYPFVQAPGSGREVVLGVRPEQVRLSHSIGPDTPQTGTLTLIEPLGPQKIVWFTCGGVLMSAIADDQWEGKVGEPIAFGFDLPRASVFDAKSEARL
jgi:multiple sugar transport system ATP-binding protein